MIRPLSDGIHQWNHEKSSIISWQCSVTPRQQPSCKMMRYFGIFSPQDAPEVLFRRIEDCREVQILGRKKTRHSSYWTMMYASYSNVDYTYVISRIGIANPTPTRYGITSRCLYKNATRGNWMRQASPVEHMDMCRMHLLLCTKNPTMKTMTYKWSSHRWLHWLPKVNSLQLRRQKLQHQWRRQSTSSTQINKPCSNSLMHSPPNATRPTNLCKQGCHPLRNFLFLMLPHSIHQDVEEGVVVVMEGVVVQILPT